MRQSIFESFSASALLLNSCVHFCHYIAFGKPDFPLMRQSKYHPIFYKFVQNIFLPNQQSFLSVRRTEVHTKTFLRQIIGLRFIETSNRFAILVELAIRNKSTIGKRDRKRQHAAHNATHGSIGSECQEYRERQYRKNPHEKRAKNHRPHANHSALRFSFCWMLRELIF